jgi:DNA-directed RNA polymerase subunit L
MSKAKSKSNDKKASIRINGEDARLLKALRTRIKSKPGVGAVSGSEIVSVALRLMGDAQVRELQERAVTTKHKKEELRQKYVATRGPISTKGFEAFMTTPAYAEFLLEQHKLASVMPLSA